MSKTAIFSGRFDPVHLGHVLTILKLLDRFDHVVVVILDYPEREGCTAQKALEVFQAVFCKIGGPGTITLVINKIHFARITIDQYFELAIRAGVGDDDVTYVSGNREVLKHFKDMGILCKFIPRSGKYSSTEERRRMNGNVNG